MLKKLLLTVAMATVAVSAQADDIYMFSADGKHAAQGHPTIAGHPEANDYFLGCLTCSVDSPVSVKNPNSWYGFDNPAGFWGAFSQNRRNFCTQDTVTYRIEFVTSQGVSLRYGYLMQERSENYLPITEDSYKDIQRLCAFTPPPPPTTEAPCTPRWTIVANTFGDIMGINPETGKVEKCKTQDVEKDLNQCGVWKNGGIYITSKCIGPLLPTTTPRPTPAPRKAGDPCTITNVYGLEGHRGHLYNLNGQLECVDWETARPTSHPITPVPPTTTVAPTTTTTTAATTPVPSTPVPTTRYKVGDVCYYAELGLNGHVRGKPGAWVCEFGGSTVSLPN